MNVSPFAQNSYFSVLDPDEDQDEDFASFIKRQAGDGTPTPKAARQDESLGDNAHTQSIFKRECKVKDPISNLWFHSEVETDDRVLFGDSPCGDGPRFRSDPVLENLAASRCGFAHCNT